MTAAEPLLPARPQLAQPLHAEGADHHYWLPADTSGEAAKFQRRRQKAPAAAREQLPTTTLANISADISADISDLTVTISQTEVADMPKTTKWRHKRKVEEGIAGVYKKHKAHYTCRKCGQPSTKETGHSQFRGYSFCPNQGQEKGEWLAEVKAKLSSKSGST